MEARVVVEVDGSQHATMEAADRVRTDALAAAGYLVLRFWNNEVLGDIDAVLTVIDDALANRPTAP